MTKDIRTSTTAELLQRISELEKSESYHKNLFSHMPIGVASHEVICSEDGTPTDYRFLEINPAFENMLGVTAEDVVGKTVLDIFPATETHWIDNWGRVALTGEPCHLEEYFESLGRYYDAHAFSPEKGKFIVVFTDVTERRLAEERKTKSEQNLRLLFQTLEDFVFVFDADGDILEVNAVVLKRLGFDRGELLRTSILDLHPPDRRADAEEIFADIVAGRRDTCPIPIVAKDGTRIPVEVKTMHGSWDEREAFICVGRDTTERMRAEEEMEKLAAVVRHCTELINIATLDGRMVFLNAAGGKMLGIEPAEVERVQIMEVIPDHLTELVTQELLPTLLRGDTWEGDLQYKNRATGELTDVHAITFAVKDTETGDPLFFANVSVDISERKQAEQRLRFSEQKYRSMFETAGDALFTLQCTSSDAGFTDCNARVTQMFGWSRDEMIGKSPSEISPPTQPDGTPSLVAAMSHINKALAGELQQFEWIHCRKDGTPFNAEVTLNRVTSGDEPLLQAAVRDTSERILADKQRRELEARLQETQKMESLSVLAGGVAHDFNNLLTGVLGNAELALEDLSPASPGREEVLRIRTAALRAAELSRQMLAYSGKGRFVLEVVSLSDVINEFRDLMAASVSKNAVLECQLAEPMPTIEVDVAQIRQVVMALLTNASEALGDEGGTIKVRTGVIENDDACAANGCVVGDVGKGQFAFVEVEDTGIGMDDDTREKMFDPFFTTKFAGRGLGLSALLGIVRGHNGAIMVDSALSRGTTIRVLFPVTPKPTRPARQTPSGKKQLLVGKTLLLVDDEPAVLEVGKIMLEKAGANVLTASDGLEAEATFVEHVTDIDCVLLDLTMPHMSGEEALRRLHDIRADVPVILSSGYGKNEIETQFGDSGFAGFLQKPYKLGELIGSITDSLHH